MTNAEQNAAQVLYKPLNVEKVSLLLRLGAKPANFNRCLKSSADTKVAENPTFRAPIIPMIFFTDTVILSR